MKRLALLVIALAVAAPYLVHALQVQPALKVPDAEQFVGKPKGTALAGQALYLRTNQVAALLRCPVCQGLSVADSPSEMAVNMKGQVRELLQRGYTEAQILQYFELSYGQFVLLEPKFEGVNTLVWLLPLAALIGGAVVVYFVLRKLSAPTAGQRPAANAPRPDDPYLARVREMVGGEGKS
ncbi:MAG TPA: cytochrome c-type biogenesis protein CcmH [Thermoanaerobaculia bacterium]